MIDSWAPFDDNYMFIGVFLVFDSLETFLGNKESQTFLLEDVIFTYQSLLHKSSISKIP